MSKTVHPAGNADIPSIMTVQEGYIYDGAWLTSDYNLT